MLFLKKNAKLYCKENVMELGKLLSEEINSEEKVKNKLILLFFMEKMEIPLTKNSILDVCSLENDWISYMDCVSIIMELSDTKFIYKTENIENDELYSITYEGRNCLAQLYKRVPYSLREKITEYVKKNKLFVKTSQEYTTNYTKNEDGSYTVSLRIYEPMSNNPMFEIKIKAPSRQSAIEAEQKWKKQAPAIYESVYENLVNTD